MTIKPTETNTCQHQFVRLDVLHLKPRNISGNCICAQCQEPIPMLWNNGKPLPTEEKTKTIMNIKPKAVQEICDIIAERDRLRKNNVELLTALQRIEMLSYDAIHSVTEARQWVRQFRDIAKAAIIESEKMK